MIFAPRFVEHVDGARLGAGKLGCLADNGAQHCFQIERRVDGLTDLAERSQLIMPFNDVSPKDFDGIDHSSNLIVTVAIADLNVGLTGRKSLHPIGNGLYGPDDRLTDYHGNKSTEHQSGKRYDNDDTLGPFGIGIKLSAHIASGVRNCRRQTLEIAVDGLEGVVRLAEHHRCHWRVGLTDVDRVLRLIFSKAPLGQQPLHGNAFQTR